MRRRLDGERDDVVRVGAVDRGLGEVRVGRVKMPVDGIAAAGLHAAEVVPGVVRVDARGRTEQQRRRALGFHAGHARRRPDAEGGGDDLVDRPGQARPALQHAGVEQDFRVVHEPADGDAEQRVALVEVTRHRPEIRDVGVGGLQRADDRGVDAGGEEVVRIPQDRAVDRAQVAHLPAAEPRPRLHRAGVAARAQPGDLHLIVQPAAHDGMQADLAAGIAAVVGMIGEIEAGLAKLLLRGEEPAEERVVGGGAREHGGIVGGGALRVLVEPAAGLRVHHLLVVGREQADGGRAADAAAEHGACGEHADVVDFDRAELAAAGAGEHGLDVEQRRLERQVAGRLAARGLQRAAARPDRREVELNLETLGVAAHEQVQGVAPALDRVAHRVVLDRQLEFLAAHGQHRQPVDVVPLHREAAACAREQQEEVFAEELHAIHRAERAVEEPGVVAEDGLTAKLQRAHRGQHAPGRHGRERPVNGCAERAAGQPLGEPLPVLRLHRRIIAGGGQRPVEPVGEELAVHPAHARRGLGEQLAAAEFGPVARVLGRGDVVGQPVLAVMIEPARGLALAVDDVGARDRPLALGGDGLLHIVLDLLDGRVPAGAVAQLRHVRDPGGDALRLAEGGRVDAVMGHRVVARGILRVVMLHLMEGEGDGARDLGRVPWHRGAIAFEHAAVGGGDGEAGGRAGVEFGEQGSGGVGHGAERRSSYPRENFRANHSLRKEINFCA